MKLSTSEQEQHSQQSPRPRTLSIYAPIALHETLRRSHETVRKHRIRPHRTSIIDKSFDLSCPFIKHDTVGGQFNDRQLRLLDLFQTIPMTFQLIPDLTIRDADKTVFGISDSIQQQRSETTSPRAMLRSLERAKGRVGDGAEMSDVLADVSV
jgi:hypothetical protein